MSSSITIPAEIDRIRDVTEFLSGYVRELGFSREKAGEVRLIAEEILVNIAKYAYPEERGDIEVDCCADNAGVVHINVIDSGVAFDPLSLPSPDLSLTLDEREIGGLGVFLVRELAETVSYTRDGNRNILTLTVTR